MSQRPRLVVADREGIVRDGLAAWLRTHAGVDVVATAAGGDESVAVVSAHMPDIVVLGLPASGPRRFDALRHIAGLVPPPRIAVLATFHAKDEITAAFDAGASACICRTDRSDELLNAIRAIHKGELYISPRVRELLLHGRPTAGSSDAWAAPLTPREREVLGLIVAGHTDRQVARILGLSVKTVHTHRTHIMGKLGVHNVTMLVRRAMQLGLVDL